MGNESITILESLCWVLSTQLFGFGLAGLARNFLIKPKEMVWPNILSYVALFVGFHNDDGACRFKISRYKFFWCCVFGCFLYSWIPQYFMVALQSVSPLCLIGFSRKLKFFISSDSGHGVGLGALTFDWY
jgi:hypothetical protein